MSTITAGTLDTVEAAASTKNLRVVYPKETEAFIDIDSEEAFTEFQRLFKIYATCWPRTTYTAAPSPSGKPGHYHVTVDADRDLSSVERIFIQSILGSDPTREMLAYCKFFQPGTDPRALSVFFELPEDAKIEQRFGRTVVVQPPKKEIDDLPF